MFPSEISEESIFNLEGVLVDMPMTLDKNINDAASVAAAQSLYAFL